MKPLTHRVLTLLADGAFHSGEDLAGVLDISRASVWQAVHELAAAGLDIYRVRGRGYKLPQPLSLLDREQIERHLGPVAARLRLEVVDSVSSTNTLLLQRAAAGAPSATVIAAEWQSGGRGRMGRAWHAGIGGALTFSLLWRFALGAGFLAGLSLAIGVALARALETLGATGIGLKWPNDVVWRGRKLAGILIEMQGDTLGPSVAVIGVGLNVRLSEKVRVQIDQAAVDLETVCGRALDRNEALAILLAALARALEQFARERFAPSRDEWQRRHVHQDRPVTVILPGALRKHGIARGVAEDGALLVESRAGVRRYHSGEISLRAKPPGSLRTRPQRSLREAAQSNPDKPRRGLRGGAKARP